jgi:uncharacterized membrane protein
MRRLTGTIARWSDSRRWQERGAAALVLALVITAVVIPMGAFAIDIGMQRVARRDAQAVADTAALDAARSLTATSTDGTVTAVASSSASGETNAVGGHQSVTAKLGYIAPTAVWSSDQSLGCNGTYSNGYFSTTVPSGKSPNAVLVVVKNSVDFGLAKAMGDSSGSVCRSAISNQVATACFSLGSYAAAIRTGDSSLLGPLLGALGTGIDTQAVSYQGLASTNIGVGPLEAALGAGTVDQLLATQVSLDSFYLAVVNALTAQGDTADANVVNAVRLKLGPVAKATPITVGSLLSASQGNGSALGLNLNALDLIAGAASIADGSSFLSIPGLKVNLAGVTTATTSLKVIQPAKVACGLPNTAAATATTAQIALHIDASVGLPLPNVLGLGVSAGPIGIDIQTAQGVGKLTGVACSASPQSMDVAVTNQLLPATITIPLTLSASIAGSIGLTAVVTTNPTNPAASTVTLKLPANVTTGVPTGAGNLNLTSAAVTTTSDGSTGVLGWLGVTLSDLVNAVNTSVLSTLETSLLTPLLNSISNLLGSLLGVTLASSSAYAQSISCSNPQLVD